MPIRTPTFDVPRLIGRAIQIGAILAITACVASGPDAPRRDARTGPMLAAFEDGCLNRQRSWRTASDAFDAQGFSYKAPFRQNPGARFRTKTADIRIPSGVTRPTSGNRDSWDTRLLGCRVGRVGLLASDLHPPVLSALARTGFVPVSPLPAPAEGTGMASGIYTRDGARFEVTLSQRVAKNPRQSSYGNVRYVRGNSTTMLGIDSLSEPVGWSMP